MHKLAASATVAALSLVSSAASATGDWSGFHVDGHADIGWMRSNWSGFDGSEGAGEGVDTARVQALAAPAFDNTIHFRAHNRDTGWGGGVGLGYNFQSGNIVFGGIVDWTWLDASDSDAFEGPNSLFINGSGSDGPDIVSTNINSFGTLRGILGFGGDQVMPYVTGGWAWGDVNRRFRSNTGIVARLDADDGWTVGGGLNWAIGPRTAINLEVLYIDFGEDSKSVTLTDTDFEAASSVHVETSMTVARAGIMFRF